jgi:hypothetical protein
MVSGHQMGQVLKHLCVQHEAVSLENLGRKIKPPQLNPTSFVNSNNTNSTQPTSAMKSEVDIKTFENRLNYIS